MPDPTVPVVDPNLSADDEQVLQRRRKEREQQLRANVWGAGDTGVAARAKAVGDVSAQLKLPPAVVDLNLEAMAGRAKFQSIPFEQLSKENPRLAQAYLDRRWAAMLRESGPSLAQTHKIIDDSITDIMRRNEPEIDQRQEIGSLIGLGAGARSAANRLGQMGWAIPAIVQRDLTNAFGGDETKAPTWSPLGQFWNLRRMQDAEDWNRRQMRQGFVSALTEAGGQLAADPTATILPLSAGMSAANVAGRTMQIAGRTTFEGGAAGFAPAAVRVEGQLVGAADSAKNSLNAAAIVGGQFAAVQGAMQSVETRRARGEDTRLMSWGELANTGAQAAIGHLSTVYGGLLAEMRLLDQTRKITSSNLATDLAGAMSSNAAGSIAGETAQSITDTGEFLSGQDLAVSGVSSAGFAGAMSIGTLATAGEHNARLRYIQATDVVRSLGQISAMKAAADHAIAMGQSRADVRTLMQSGLPANLARVHIAPDALQALATARSVTMDELIADLGLDPKAVADAQALGHEVPVPTHALVDGISSAELQTLGDRIRFNNNGATLAEVRDEVTAIQAVRRRAQAEAEANTLLAEAADDEATKQLVAEAAGSVSGPAGDEATAKGAYRAQWVEQLVAAGESQAAAEAAADLWVNRQDARAKRLSLPFDQVAQFNPITVTRQGAAILDHPLNTVGRALAVERGRRAAEVRQREEARIAAIKSRDEAAAAAEQARNTRLQGKEGDDLIADARTRLAKASAGSPAPLAQGSSEALRALGEDFGIAPDASAAQAIKPEAKQRLDDLKHALNLRGQTFKTLFADAFNDSRSMAAGQAPMAWMNRRLSAPDQGRPAAASEAVANATRELIDVSRALNDPRAMSAMPEETRAEYEAKARQLAEQIMPELDKQLSDMAPEDATELVRAMHDAGQDVGARALAQGPEQVDAAAAPMPDTIEVDGKQRPTLNSNGKRIAATEEAVRNFWKWFGDSKVVDEQGRPLVVHHGTDADFDAFDVDSKHKNTSGNIRGIYVTNRGEADAQQYGALRVLALYAKAESPYRASGGNKITPVFEEAYRAALVKENRHLDPKDTWFDDEVSSLRRRGLMPYNGLSSGAQRKVLMAGGFDSVSDGPHWALLSATQVKSATGNRGTFDPSNPSILYQALGARVPTGKNRFEDPLTQQLRADLEPVLRKPELVGKMRTKLEGLGAVVPNPGEADEQFIQRFIDRVVDNLLALHDAMPQDVRDRAKLWYDGAEKIASEWAQKYGVEKRTVAGVLAVLSPQKDWYQNVDLARRVLDIVTKPERLVWDDAMLERGLPHILASATASINGTKRTVTEDLVAEWRKLPENKRKKVTDKIKAELFDDYRKQALNEITQQFRSLAGREWNSLTEEERGRFIRLRDMADSPQSYLLVTPEGTFGDPVLTKSGDPARVGWAGYKNLGKAAGIIQDQSIDAISSAIGNEHKVRNFYNNIFDPKNPTGFVTIDTHAIAAALLRPLAGSDVPVKDNFGGMSDADSGISGTYPIYAEAYKIAAQERGILPREMQSITWEAVRGLFTDTFKTAKNKAAVEDIWKRHIDGSISYDDAVAAVADLAGGITHPTWHGVKAGPDLGGNAAQQPAKDRADVSAAGWPVRRAERGNRAGDSAGVRGGITLNQPAYHGTGNAQPYDRFRYDLVGGAGGEGAQAYGWGLYFASMKEVAEGYRTKLSNNMATIDGVPLGQWLEQKGLDRFGLRDLLMQALRNAGGDPEIALSHNKDIRLMDALEQMTGDVKMPERGKLYRVDVPDEHELMSWDASLDAQSPQVKDGIRRVLVGIGMLGVDRAEHPAIVDANRKIAEKFAGDFIERNGEWTGEQFYNYLADKLKDYGPQTTKDMGWTSTDPQVVSYKAASDALRESGIPGLRYLDGVSRAAGDGSHNYVIFDDSRIAIQAYEQPGAAPIGEPWRGRIIHDPRTRSARIELAAKRDASTFAHESFHHWLFEMLLDADRPEATQQMRDDARLTLRKLGVTDQQMEGKTFTDLLDGLTVDQHEKWAGWGETYLRTSKAPSKDLATTFSRFRSWIGRVWRGLMAKGTQPEDIDAEVSGIMDRLLATDDAIQAANANDEAMRLQALADSPIRKLLAENPEQAALAAQLADDAQREQSDAMAERAAAESRREQTEAWRADMQQEREAVTAEVDAQPVYQAIAKIAAKDLPADQRAMRLEPGAVRALLNEAHQYADKKLLNNAMTSLRGKQVLAPNGGGVHPDAIAEAMGYASGIEMVLAIVGARPRQQLIDAVAAERMRQKHGDLKTDPALAEEAGRRAINNSRARLIQLEMSALTRKSRQPGAPIPTVEVVRRYARDQIAGRAVYSIEPALYRRAMDKAAREAFVAAGEGRWDDARAAKHRELVNHELLRAAEQAVEASKKGRDYLAKFENNSVRERIIKAGGGSWSVTWTEGGAQQTKVVGTIEEARQIAAMSGDPNAAFAEVGGYMEQIEGVLDGFSLRRASKKRLALRDQLRRFVEYRQELGEPIDIPEGVVADLGSKRWDELTPLQQKDAVEAIEQIDNLARINGKLLAAHRQASYEDAKAELLASIEANAPRNADQSRTANTPGEKMGAMMGDFMGAHVKDSFLARELDGYQDGGAAWDLLIRPRNDAANREAVMIAAVAKERAEQMAAWGKKTTAVIDPDLKLRGKALTNEERIAVALNYGNAEGRQRLLYLADNDQEMLDRIIKSLDAADRALVEATWRLVDRHWSEIQALEKRTRGVQPIKVDAVPYQVGDVTMTGGYYPISYGSDNAPARGLGAFDEATGKLTGVATGRATTRAGSVHARAKTVNKDIKLDFGVVAEHLRETIHDITHREVVRDQVKILNDPEIQQAIRQKLGIRGLKQLADTVRYMAQGDKQDNDGLSKTVRFLRRNGTGATFAFNLSSALLNITGFANSLTRLGPVEMAVGAKHFVGIEGQERSLAGIHRRSEFMRTRHQTWMREVAEAHRMGATGLRDRMWLIGYWPMAKVQQLVDGITWAAAYEKALRGGAAESDAVAVADQTVRDTQGSGQIQDMAGVQRGGELKKAFTTFYSYFGATYQLQREGVLRAAYRGRGDDWMALGSATLLATFVPAMVGALLGQALRGDDVLDDPEKLAKKLALEQIGYTAGYLVLVRDIVGPAVSGFGWEGPAGTRGVGALGDAIDGIFKGDLKTGDIKKAITAAGFLSGLPATEINRAVDAWVLAGERGEYADAARILLFGKPRADR